MGYTTEFNGCFSLSQPLHPKIHDFLIGLSSTRRVKRKLPPIYGTDGEFFVGDRDNMGQTDSPDIIDHNCPPATQPGLWCQWVPDDEGTYLQWDGNEKFYNYVEWIEYIVDKILAPNRYKVNGEVKWQGEDMDDRGKIIVVDNVITTQALE